MTAEHLRLQENDRRERYWSQWGPYVSERQWGTVREDYSATGDAWTAFPHDHARSRAYRWGEDGLLGISDSQCRMCFALALWNGRDAILKERLFGLTGPQGNHGEDVKEHYFYLDATPTASYLRALYKYPQAAFPYDRLIEENARRGLHEREFELGDTGIFDNERYFDVAAEYAKAAPDDIAISITITNRGPDPAPYHLLPTLWFRNQWTWNAAHESLSTKPTLELERPGDVAVSHPDLGDFTFHYEDTDAPPLFTENETNTSRLYGQPNATPFVKDGFHDAVIHGDTTATHPTSGTKFAPHLTATLAPGESRSHHLRLTRRPASHQSTQPDQRSDAGSPASPRASALSIEKVLTTRRAECDAFHAAIAPSDLSADARSVTRQGYAGLVWSKQFYHYIVEDWIAGDEDGPPPPGARASGRNSGWPHLYARDILSMPDKWEYPWFAAWDSAFHMLPFARIDPGFAKSQLALFLREWYLHPNGQIPAYEWNFSDVNPPVHAWAAWRVYKMAADHGQRDRSFLESTFQKLLLNFTWWVNRKDADGNNLFCGGFLGLDNIGVFDRSKPLPTGGTLQQADGTAWMAFYSLTMLAMALELARENPVYEDLASKFFEHFVYIADAMNELSGEGLWDDTDGFYYDQLKIDGHSQPLRTRSLVGLLPLIAVEVIDEEQIDALPAFRKRMDWFIDNRSDLDEVTHWCRRCPGGAHRILAIPSRERLTRTLAVMLDESEFLSPHGIRSLSKAHADHPFVFRWPGGEERVSYVSAESDSHLFGGNSNWRGPIWFPVNYLLIEALERYHHFYGDDFQIECPTGSGQFLDLEAVAAEISRRLGSIFLPDEHGHRPCNGGDPLFDRENWRDYVLFSEYFDGDTARGLGASHQTGWTALIVKLLEDQAS